MGVRVIRREGSMREVVRGVRVEGDVCADVRVVSLVERGFLCGGFGR
jgi:hypothetical protein